MKSYAYLFCLAAALPAAASADVKVWLDELPVDLIECGWGKPAANKSVAGNALKIGEKTFKRGVGTHAESIAAYKTDGNAISFQAEVGVDAEVRASGKGSHGSVRFEIYADGRKVAESPLAKGGEGSVRITADLRGAQTVELCATQGGDGNTFDHADWADAFFTMKDGTRPVPEKIEIEQLGILTPPEKPEPRINWPRIYGARPGSPILWRPPVSGIRPMTFKAGELPRGLKFDAEKGIFTGAVEEPGIYTIHLNAVNAKGATGEFLTLAISDGAIALTPPMGWNSWNCFAGAVTARDIENTIEVFDKSGLAGHGWSYINIDDYWQNKPSAKNDPTLQGPERLPDGSIAVNKRFPSMKALADLAHSKGFKIGLYSSPGPYTCGGCTGSWKHEWQDAKTYADWGYDYLKYDWCYYRNVAFGEGHAKFFLPYRLMGAALRAQKRDIVYSLCQYGMDNVSTWGASTGGNCWRTTGDITDTWDSMWSILQRQEHLWQYARPGAWNDPDMLVVGRLGWGKLRPSRLTPNEQYTHISMWSILCSPLLIGCDLTQMDDFTKSLLCNDEVIAVNQDRLGAQAACVAKGPRAQIWAKPMGDGSLVFALINTHPTRKTRITVDFDSLGVEGRWNVRDLWRQQDLGEFTSAYGADVPPHATVLVRMYPMNGAGLRKGLADIRENATFAAFAAKRPVDMPGYNAPKGPPCAECPRNRAAGN